MRNWHPFLHETLAEMQEQGHRRALGIILSSFQTEASWDRYVTDVAAARQRVGDDAPEVVYAPAWADHPLFLDVMTDRSVDGAGEGAGRAPARGAPRLHRAQRARLDGRRLALRGAVRIRDQARRRASRPRAMVAGLSEPKRLAA